MGIQEKIKQLRNASNDPKLRTLLGVVLAEFTRNKNVKIDVNGNKTLEDSECIRVLKSMMEANKLTNNLEENEILMQWVPQQLDSEEIESIILNNHFNNMKDCQEYFKRNYSGCYDGKAVSIVFNKLTKK